MLHSSETKKLFLEIESNCVEARLASNVSVSHHDVTEFDNNNDEGYRMFLENTE